MPGLVLLLGLVASLALAVPQANAGACPGADTEPSAATLDQAREAAMCLVNGERRRHGDGRLRTNAVLQHSATLYARAMVRESFFGHVSPSGLTFGERIRRETHYLDDARSWRIGENIAWGSGSEATPAEIVRSWMASPVHRRILLDGAYREMGLGIAIGSPVDATDSSAAATFVNHFGRRG
jgi:uncharacterized protein YkwD